MFPEPTELLLIGDSIELIWTTKIQIKCIDTRNQLADILTKGNCKRDEWKHLLCLCNNSQFSSTYCAEVMSKKTQKDSGEERVTAKSKPMMNLVSRCSERTPDVLPSTAPESPGEPDTKVNFIRARELSSIKEQGNLLKTLTHQATQKVDKTWSSQEWKSDELMEVRTGWPVLFCERIVRGYSAWLLIRMRAQGSFLSSTWKMKMIRRMKRKMREKIESKE